MSVTDREISRAEIAGRVAAKGGCAVTSCPFEADGTDDQRLLAQRFVRAFLAAGGRVPVDYGDGRPTRWTTTKPGQKISVVYPKDRQ